MAIIYLTMTQFYYLFKKLTAWKSYSHNDVISSSHSIDSLPRTISATFSLSNDNSLYCQQNQKYRYRHGFQNWVAGFNYEISQMSHYFFKLYYFNIKFMTFKIHKKYSAFWKNFQRLIWETMIHRYFSSVTTDSL